MDRDFLETSLEKIFMGQASFGDDYTTKLKRIAAVFDYYREGDVSPEVLEAANKIHNYLIHLDNYRYVVNNTASVPAEFQCTLIDRDHTASNFTFSPVVNWAVSEQPFHELNRLMESVGDLSVSAITYYIKEKAISKGDFK